MKTEGKRCHPDRSESLLYLTYQCKETCLSTTTDRQMNISCAQVAHENPTRSRLRPFVTCWNSRRRSNMPQDTAFSCVVSEVSAPDSRFGRPSPNSLHGHASSEI